jgi:demethylspheroidene O-methyltransferase
MSQTYERWIKWRNDALANPKLQRFLASFPLTRPVANAKARQTFGIVSGFVSSQIMQACIELDLLELLRPAPLSAEAIAARCDLPVDATLTLLKAASAINLLETLRDGRFALGGDGAAMLGNPGIAEMIMHHRALYLDLADPVALLRRGGGGGTLANFWTYGGDDQAIAERYSTLMAASQPMIAGQVLDAYTLRGHPRLLDIGGGEGAFLAEVAVRWPQLDLTLFDLPMVAARAGERLGTKARVVGGSFIDDPLPEGADIITLIRVLHDHDDGVAQALLNKVYNALPPRGTLLIAEPMAQTPGARAMGHGYFGMYLLAMGSGRPRTPDELKSMLAKAGFSSVRLISTRTPLTCRVIIATR